MKEEVQQQIPEQRELPKEQENTSGEFKKLFEN